MTTLHCVWDDALLRHDNDLPEDLLQAIRHGSDAEYIQAFSRTILQPQYTYLILAYCEDFLAQICTTLRSHAGIADCVATLGRLVPFAPFLTPYAVSLLESEALFLSEAGDSEDDIKYLLGLLRLLRVDHRAYRKLVPTHSLATRLGSCSRPVAYVIVRILQLTLQGADGWLEECIKRYTGPDASDEPIHGEWDEKIIDYRFLSWWEDRRHHDVRSLIQEARSNHSLNVERQSRALTIDGFNGLTCVVGDTMLPRLSDSKRSSGPLILTETTKVNLRYFGQALKDTAPTLLAGPASSGKTMLARHVAASVGKLHNLVELHLNEQSDAKLLLGVYTTGSKPGTFVWKPGVLLTAALEGRWVLIEDLNRVPSEILGTLLPLIERGELNLPGRNEVIHAAPGFRIIATIRTVADGKRTTTSALSHMLGFRHWRLIDLENTPISEQSAIAEGLMPIVKPLLPQMTQVYERLVTVQASSSGHHSSVGISRSLGLREFLKWCQRASRILNGLASFTTEERDDIFVEAIDCFLGALPGSLYRVELIASIAEEMQIDPQRRDHLCNDREIAFRADKKGVSIGRYNLSRLSTNKINHTSFSTNPHTIRTLDRVAAAVTNREPLLLVGETGVGKTTAIQYLANHLGKKLVPFNLSQQSEVGDLLGGFKPVSTKALMIPLIDEFNTLFAASFSASKNKQYLELLNKQVKKSSWRTVCKLWHQALKMVAAARPESSPRPDEAPTKRRKIDTAQSIDFDRWDTFAVQMRSLESRLANGDDVFAFSFIEGNIVKALRNGDWILLDEINLASSDTLEALTDLLDTESPSLLLTEAGNIERVVAHSDFRVFAAMNPATDVGKKDLPPAVRSRFSELYVESPDKDLKSLQSIVRAYLGSSADHDKAVTMDVSLLYQKIIELSAANRMVDGAGQKPHFSLRTLTRTLTFANSIQTMCSLRRALFEGFQMSFLTALDVESRELVLPLIKQHIFGKKVNIKAEIGKSLQKPNDGSAYARGHDNSKHWIRKGKFETFDQPEYIITPYVEANLENLVRAASTRKFPVLIQGPTSSGKTSMIEYLAKKTGHKFVRINNHEHTDLQEYLGTYASNQDGRLAFQEGVLVQALREGHWLVLDELNLAPTDVLEALNRLLDDNRELLIPETQETVRPHPDFMLFATQNPAGLYGGRKTLSRAFRNRFLELHFDDIPIDELQNILIRRTQRPESWCRHIIQVYKELSILRQESRMFEQKSFATLRDLFRWALRQNDTKQHLAENGYMLLCERVRKPEEREALKAIIEKVLSAPGPRVQIDSDHIYQEVTNNNEISEVGQGVVWTKAMRRLYALVARAVQNNEPVLLVGETGCGKTTVCQILAEVQRQKLHILNAHQNTETGDLIGSQRPVRNRSQIETKLREHIMAIPSLQPRLDLHHSTEEMLSAYDEMVKSLEPASKQKHLQSAIHMTIATERTRWKALFEWTDGSLVQAMKNGEYFLLDEISLADDSVLERLNSVLESQRTILLAEKGSEDASVTAVGGFQFFATMNPGGDYGKRELSPALRNRFTEIWVPAFADTDDVLQIVVAKLTSSAHAYADTIVRFAAWFKRRYDTSTSASVSIRDTLAWVEFVNSFAHVDLQASVVHGAAMVYVDTLGANPAGLMSIASSDLALERKECLNELSRLLDLDAAAIYDRPLTAQLSDTSFAIGPFHIPRNPTVEATQTAFSFDPPTTQLNSMRVLRALQVNKPILLEGSPGVGKTAIVTAIAQVVGMPLTRINLSDQTDLLDLFGSDAPVEGASAGTFTWRDAPFLRALKHGEWVLLDEMNLASQPVLEGLNSCLDHRGEVFISELGQTFRKHNNFRLFAAQNPHYQGGGRKGLPASFVNRFTVVYADSFRSEDLTLICKRTFPDMSTAYIEQAVAFVTRLQSAVLDGRRFGANGGPWEFNLRDIARWLELASSKGLLRAGSPRDFVHMLFAQRFRDDADRTDVDALFEQLYGKVPRADLFCGVTSRQLQIGLGQLPRALLTSQPQDLSPRSSPMRLSVDKHQSTLICVQQKWPVILVGTAGAGKTSLISRLAALTGATVTTLTMNSETDALDLIGTYEQYDPSRKRNRALQSMTDRVQELVKNDLIVQHKGNVTTASRCLQHLEASDVSADAISQLIQDLPEPTRAHLQQYLPDLVVQRDVTEAQFEWLDGPLVQSLKEGTWLVLDNANLCSPAVLDRLNSLLEPNGCLIVSEHAEADGQPRVIRPHPDFRIFMTMDPRFGELSRAMRNRAVELYMPSDSRECVQPHALFSESAMARFMCSAPTEAQPSISDHDLVVALDHLSVADTPLVTRWQEALESESQSGAAYARRMIGNSEQTQLSKVEASTLAQSPADLDCLQTFHPLNNQPFIQQTSECFQQALSLGSVFDLRAALASQLRVLRDLHADHRLIDKLTRFTKDLSKQSSARDLKRPISMLISVESILSSIVPLLNQADHNSSDLLDSKAALRRIIAFCIIVLQAALADHLDGPRLRALVAVGNKVAVQSQDSPLLSEALSKIQYNVQSMLPQAATLAANDRFDSLWRLFKAESPATFADFETLERFKAIFARFDAQALLSQYSPDDIVKTRLSFSRALNLGLSNVSSLNALIEQTEKAFIGETDDASEKVEPRQPHFVGAFEQLCRQLASSITWRGSLREDDIVMLEFLSQRSTADSLLVYSKSSPLSPSQSLRLLGLSFNKSVAESTHQDTDAPFGSEAVVTEILNKSNTVSTVTLADLRSLNDESRQLSTYFAMQAHGVYEDAAVSYQQIFQGLVSALIAGISDQVVTSIQDLRQFSALLEGSSAAAQGLGPFLYDRTLTDRLLVCIQRVLASPQDIAAKPWLVAFSWMSFAMVGIESLADPNAYDPVEAAMLHRAVFHYCKDDLTQHLQSLERYRKTWSGQKESLRSRLVQNEIIQLGDGPQIVQVCRPPVSQYSALSAIFAALQRTLDPLKNLGVKSAPDEITIALQDPLLWRNLKSVEARLVSDFAAYADITTPVAGFIDCLRMARRYASIASKQDRSILSTSTLQRIVPLMGVTCPEWLSDETFVNIAQACRSQADNLAWLSLIAIRSCARSATNISSALRQEIDDKFHRFYELWKLELTRDQKAAAAKSSLYKYRGDDEVRDDEVALEGMNELFPTYDAAPSTMEEQPTSNKGVQQAASELATIFNALYRPEEMTADAILVQVKKVAMSSSTALSGTTSAPVVIQTLSLLQQHLSSEVSVSTGRNMYTDANVAQSARLVNLVEKMQIRFRSLQKAFPENVLPHDVLVECDRILKLGHAEPVAKYMPYVETLHDRATEWQKVASSQYSVNDLLEETVNLVVSWRRLELSTWNTLFDREDEQCEQDAASWWFVAYEAIVQLSDAAVDDEHQMITLTTQLAQALVGFISGCGLGEYKVRIEMLKDFAAALSCRAFNDSKVHAIVDCLNNVISYFAPFGALVTEHLNKRRTELSKDVKEIIQLFAWKTRNIRDMSANAKASHKKLFRIVRKYRRLLAEPVTGLLKAEYPVSQNEVKSVVVPADTSSLHHSVLKPGEAPHAATTESRPLSATQPIRSNNSQEYSNETQPAAVVGRITKFLRSIQEETKELRKATPSKATDQNKSVIQHLKTRKRRLLADVLRDLRLMGFQSNISEDILQQQASLQDLLARSKYINNHNGLIDACESAQETYNRILHIVPVARDASIKHSEDLTPAEVARCKVLLESMVYASSTQRSAIAKHLSDYTALTRVVEDLTYFVESTDITVLQQKESSVESLRSGVKSSVAVVESCIKMAEMQGQLASRSYTSVTSALSQVVQDLNSMRIRLLECSSNLSWLRNAEIASLADGFDKIRTRTHGIVRNSSESQPELAPLLEQLSQWWSPTADAEPGNGSKQSYVDLVSWNSSFESALQRVQHAMASLGSVHNSTDDKKAWLLNGQRRMNSKIDVLELGQAARGLRGILDAIPTIRDDGGEIITRIQATCRHVVSIYQSLTDLAEQRLSASIDLHIAMNDMAFQLATSFITLASQGFCTPSDKSASDDQKSGEVQSGTGLGDGEGAEDISKDVGDDEDLSELAQENKPKDAGEEMEKEQDAVDMADEDLDGEFDEVGSEKGEEGSDGEEQDEQDLDEEIGDVDDADPAATEDKQWDAGKENEKQDKEIEKGKGTKSEDIAAAEGAEGEEQEMDDEAENEQDMQGAEGQDDTEAPPDLDQADNRMANEENLDLPDDLAMEGDKMDESDDGGFSDAEIDNTAEEVEDAGAEPVEDQPAPGDDVEMDVVSEGENEDAEMNGEAEADDADQDNNDEDQHSDVAMLDQNEQDQEKTDGLVSADNGQGHEESAEAQPMASTAADTNPVADDNDPSDNSGKAQGTSGVEKGNATAENATSDGKPETNPMKKLGDILEQWYQQHRNIEAASDEPIEQADQDKNEADADDPRFQHIPEEDSSAMQALGAAPVDQSKALDDDNAIPVNEQEDERFPHEDAPMSPEQEKHGLEQEDNADSGQLNPDINQATSNRTMIGEVQDTNMGDPDNEELATPQDELDDVDDQLINTHLSSHPPPIPIDPNTARQKWSDHESRTRNMSLLLTEQLRLILQPTQATKMRGDFRTGKRLNIKKIIPYIASSYKRDKIWMRRAVPSKRNYQIMLAIDDSSSMAERQTQTLAFDTLALVARSLAMLEVGELSIVAFGSDVRVAHEFGVPFNADAGVEVLRQFSFAQSRTDVRALLERSLELFRAARLRAVGAAGDLWQLMLIVSDGECEDHAGIRRLVRQAHEERILVVFVIVDEVVRGGRGGGEDAGVKQSIVDLPRAEFVKDANGEMQVKMVKYLETFPFRYYLIVRDVLELPSVLAGALRQWFAEVSGMNG